jgi:hypothetical protein
MATDSFHAFLSHNTEDKPIVKRVAEALERAQLRPWLDAWHLVPGEAWQPAIEEALRKSACCVVFVGRSGIGAWQHEEMRAAIDRRVTAARSGQPFRVIPVLLPGSQKRNDSELPVFLTATTWVKFHSDDDANAVRTLERAIRGLPPRDERQSFQSAVHHVRVFVSSHDDVEAERGALNRVIDEINRDEGKTLSVRLEFVPWELDVIPRIADKTNITLTAQATSYDIYLGIASVRFDASNNRAAAGTEEAFNAALNCWQTAGEPWIKFFFNDAPDGKEISKHYEQFGKLREFRKKVEELRLAAGYEDVNKGDSAFRTKVDLHLRRVVHEIFPTQKSQLPPPPETPPPPTAVGHYLKRLANDTEHLTLLGMGRSFQVELPIDEAYIPLQATAAQSLELKPTERPRDGHDIDLGDVFRETAQRKMRAIVVLGEPGSGKTTAARQVAWQLSGGRSRSAELGLPTNLVPVLLRFRNLSRAALDSPEPLSGLRLFLDQETRCSGAPSGQGQPGEALWDGQAGGLLWILDGLDEVVDPADRQRVAGWLRSAVTERPNDWFFVTCRFQGYFREGVPLGPKFAEFHVRPLDDQQVEQFVRVWLKAAYGKLLGPGAVASNKAQADSDQLLGILKLSENQLGHIRELCANPLLLTILCIVFHEERKLPTGRAELYAHCVRVLLEYWRRDLYTTDLGTKLKPYDAEAASFISM